jgi:putative DNA primase/helicase
MSPSTLRLYPENIPEELKKRRQWVNWTIEQRDGKPTKIPKQPHGPNAHSDKAATWSTFKTCLEAVVEKRFMGLGYVFNLDYTGTDFDNCVDPVTRQITDGRVERWVRQLDSYTEYSQSGRGLHVINRCTKPTEDRSSIMIDPEIGLKVEMYDVKRFFIMTGDLYGSNEHEEPQ